jgi:hypothetical protein
MQRTAGIRHKLLWLSVGAASVLKTSALRVDLFLRLRLNMLDAAT